jgi:hypothetical protein
MKQRLHWILTLAALSFAVSEFTPLGSVTVEAGVAAVKAPLYASGVLQRGPRGPRGPRGRRGRPGLRGQAVVARPRSIGTIATPGDDPLTGNTWTQGAKEDDLIVGTITFQSPPVCTLNAGQSPNLLVTVKLDGAPVGSFSLNPQFAGPTVTFPNSVYVFSPGTDTPRTLTATISSDCAEPFTVSDLELDVAALV